MKIYKSLSLLLLFALLEVNAQNANEYYNRLKTQFSTFGANCLMENQVKLTLPSDHEVVKMEKGEVLTFMRSPAYKWPDVSWVYSKMKSKDNKFVTFIDVSSSNYSKDGIYVYTPLAPDLKLKIDEQHLGQINTDYSYNTGKDNAPQNLHYKSTDDARQKCNADTIITYSMKVWKAYEEKYNRCKVMIIQKNQRGYIRLLTLYNNKDKRVFNRYQKTLEKMIWYREPNEFLNFTIPKDTATVIPIIDNEEQ